MYVLTILVCIIVIVAVFLILSLDKVIIKPLIRNYTTLGMNTISDQAKSFTVFTTNISGMVSYEK